MAGAPGLSLHDQLLAQAELKARTRPADRSNAVELPAAENARLIVAYASGLGQFARWQTARDMHADLARDARVAER